jgi:phosphomannomutase / phosphoglucomutase
VTASHNPAEDNGIKLQVRDAEAYAGEELQSLRRRIEDGNLLTGDGSVEPLDSVSPYLDHLAMLFKNAGKGLHVVIDAGNGVAGPAYTEALKRIGCTVIELYTEPIGTFPNHPADPSKYSTLKELQETVKEAKADIGLAFDGDGDRLGLVNEKGTILSSDEVLLLLAKDHLQRHKGGPVIFTVSNSGALQSEIEQWGGKPVMCKVGHSFVEHAMREHGALLGGEQSGHFFCGEDYYGYDDALVAALHVLTIVKKSGKNLSALTAAFPRVYQAPEERPYCPDGEKTRIVKAITTHFAKIYPVNDLDGARIDFGEGAWAGIRQSNTSPCLSICLEARSPRKLEEIAESIHDHIALYPEVRFEAGSA